MKANNVTLASLAKGNALAGSFSELYDIGFVSLIHIANCMPNMAISDFWIELSLTEITPSDHNGECQLTSNYMRYEDTQCIPWVKFLGPVELISKPISKRAPPETGGPLFTSRASDGEYNSAPILVAEKFDILVKGAPKIALESDSYKVLLEYEILPGAFSGMLWNPSGNDLLS